MKKNNKRGFTLLEILIVLVILAVLAGLSITSYASSVKKAKSQEALRAISVIRIYMTMYFSIRGTYVGASLAQADAGFIGFDPADSTIGQTLNFTYGLDNLTDNSYVVYAICTTC